MKRISSVPRRPTVPECWPALIAIFGGIEEAQKAVDREPMLLIMQSDHFFGKLARLRKLLGRDGASKALEKAPYFLLHEYQRKSHRFTVAFDALERIFGTEDAIRLCTERPE